MNQNFLVDSPLINPENTEFWEAANAGTLLVKKCHACNRYHWYPRIYCPYCGSPGTQWTPVSGRGTVYSYTFMSAPTSSIPAYVTLEEGLTLLTQLIRDESSPVTVGMPVNVAFVHSASGQAVPVFRLRSAASAAQVQGE